MSAGIEDLSPFAVIHSSVSVYVGRFFFSFVNELINREITNLKTKETILNVQKVPVFQSFNHPYTAQFL